MTAGPSRPIEGATDFMNMRCAACGDIRARHDGPDVNGVARSCVFDPEEEWARVHVGEPAALALDVTPPDQRIASYLYIQRKDGTVIAPTREEFNRQNKLGRFEWIASWWCGPRACAAPDDVTCPCEGRAHEHRKTRKA